MFAKKKRMKQHLQKLAISGMLAGLVACGSNETKTESPVESMPENGKSFVLDKLLGTWQGEDGKSFERWTKETDERYRSFVYSLNGKDTLVNERAVVYRQGAHWVFENQVSGQNDGKSIKFVSAFVKEDAIQFSNPGHDFPNEIHYAIPDHEHINAFIVGNNEKGGKDTIPFNYKRVN